MQLVKPSTQYKDSFIAAVKEFQEEKSRFRQGYLQLDISKLEKDFDAYVQKVLSHEKGENLPEGYVPQSTYWLIDDGEYIGRVDIRHRLTEFLKKLGGHLGYDIRPSKRRQGYGSKLLEMAIQKSKEMGIKEVLVACDKSNIGSNKIIQKNGGILKESVSYEEDRIKEKYIIK